MVFLKRNARRFCSAAACSALLFVVSCAGQRQEEPGTTGADTLQQKERTGESAHDTAMMEQDTGAAPMEE